MQYISFVFLLHFLQQTSETCSRPQRQWKLLFQWYCIDILQGMRYIHRSELGSHGQLRSDTCLVDSRWTVKISGFGLHSLTNVVRPSLGEDDNSYSSELWTAPELLRMPYGSRLSGTDKGDVYSFGIMLQEILYRNTPFFYGDISAMGKSMKLPASNYTMAN